MIYIVLNAVFALIFAVYLRMKISNIKITNKKVAELTSIIKGGALSFLSAQYRIIFVFMFVSSFPIAYYLGLNTMYAFVCGAFFSVLCGNIGMRAATMSNGRTTEAAHKYGISGALDVAFSGGLVMGMSVAAIGLLGIVIFYYLFEDISVIQGFAMGASSIALFARVGGGIFTKAADVGADLVGKVESSIPEDDPRNPAVIADNVGDNVGDVAGMGADLFESYVGSIIAAMSLSTSAVRYLGGNISSYILAPLLISSAGLFASIIGSIFIKYFGRNVHSKLENGTLVAGVVSAISTYFIVTNLGLSSNVLYAIAIGLISGVLIARITGYYTEKNKAPVNRIVKSSETGAGTTIIEGLAVGMESTALPIITIAIATIFAFNAAGLYGIAIAAVGMLSITGIIVSIDAYGAIADNAGGMAEMSGMPSKVREVTDELDAVGNTTAAVGKGFAIGSAALTSISIFAAYKSGVESYLNENFVVDVSNPKVMAGIFIGGMITLLFASLTMRSVGKAAMKMVKEVRRQFKTIPGIMDGTGKPDYASCIDISARAALQEMILPGVIAVAIPICVGLWDVFALAGLLVGSLSTGVLLAILMANAGGAWDNAKKQIEELPDGKGSEAHKAAVIGDIVGDPFKDTSGPSLNIFIKLMSIVSLVLIPLFVR
tara:strand:- start:5656 stop:7632 length:1977 start_codon:yes stop_codon:yes gene_type:complete